MCLLTIRNRINVSADTSHMWFPNPEYTSAAQSARYLDNLRVTTCGESAVLTLDGADQEREREKLEQTGGLPLARPGPRVVLQG